MKRKYTLLIYTENHVGLLNRISIIFTRHKVNIESLNTSPAMETGFHSFCITIETTQEVAEHLRKIIDKQVEVLRAFLYEENQVIAQEVALFKVATASVPDYNVIEQLVRTSNARILAIDPQFFVIEKTGLQKEIQGFLDELTANFDVREFIQSGRVVVTRPMGKLIEILDDLEKQEEK